MSNLPDGVSINKEGRLEFVTQRGYFAPPYESCMFAALCMGLIWAGYELPLARQESRTPPENFVWALHKASGAPLDSGTTIADTQKALQVLLPDAPVSFASATATDILTLLAQDAAVRVVVNCRKLPSQLKRWVGQKYTGKHAIEIIGIRQSGDPAQTQVFWLDPMGRPSAGYVGVWVDWNDVFPAIRLVNGEAAITYIFRNAAVVPPVEPPVVIPPPINGGGSGDTQMILSNVVEHSRGVVGHSTAVLHPETLKEVMTVPEGTTVKLVGVTPDGKYRGVLVNSRQIEGDNPKVALIDASALSSLSVDDHTEELQKELDAANAKSAEDVSDAQRIVNRHGA